MSGAPISPADRDAVHAGCVVCDPGNARGLAVEYRATAEGVEALFECHPEFRGYSGTVHGGVIAALLDGAMTHCLFARGLVAVTAELSVKYHRPVVTGERATIRAWSERDLSPLQLVRAELVQGAVVKAAASAKFMEAGQLLGSPGRRGGEGLAGDGDQEGGRLTHGGDEVDRRDRFLG
ncbi:MAG TPA: PaaI family thioesterase [Vicinamibacteria bacterium]|nr:PaaI family thioesterase [Vicinamibacteria bacterium]